MSKFFAARPAFVPFLMAGDPDFETTEACASALIEEGASAVEIGMPFSDPVADGPVLQAAAERALAKGATTEKVLALVAKIHDRHPQARLVLFGYLNPILAYGQARFVREARAAGAAALLAVDLPLEEAASLRADSQAVGLGNVFLVSPTTTIERARAAAEASQAAFLYVVSSFGVTGARAQISQGLEAQVARLREITQTPLGIGFGVSNAEQAVRVGRVADAVIVGSALVDRLARAPDQAAAVREARAFAREIMAGLKNIGGDSKS